METEQINESEMLDTLLSIMNDSPVTSSYMYTQEEKCLHIDDVIARDGDELIEYIVTESIGSDIYPTIIMINTSINITKRLRLDYSQHMFDLKSIFMNRIYNKHRSGMFKREVENIKTKFITVVKNAINLGFFKNKNSDIRDLISDLCICFNIQKFDFNKRFGGFKEKQDDNIDDDAPPRKIMCMSDTYEGMTF